MMGGKGWAGGMKLHIHPLFLLLLAFSAVAGLLPQVLLFFFMVLIHEWGHVVVAQRLGYKMKKVVLLPFGGVAQLEHGRLGWNPRHEALIAVAGPACNLLLIALAIALSQGGMFSSSFTSLCIQENLLLVFFNLLPAMPLDGGRILRATLSRHFGFRMASEVSLRMAFLLSLLLILLGLASLWSGYMNLGIGVLGFFLFFSAWQLRRQLRYDTIRFLDTKRRSGIKGLLPLRSLVVQADMPIRRVVDEFAPDAYHMVYVMDADKRLLDVIAEDDLLEGYFSGGAARTLREHISAQSE